MANKQKQVQQETACLYGAVVDVQCTCMYPRPHLYSTCLYDPFGVKKRCRDGDTFTTTAPYRQSLVALVFADLPSLHPFFYEMISTQ